MTNNQKLVIIGCGMAGARILEELFELQNAPKLDITIVGEEPGGNYDRIRLTELLKREAVDELWLNEAN